MATLTTKLPTQPTYLSPNNNPLPSQPRKSTDTEHRHLLSDAQSIAPSGTTSYAPSLSSHRHADDEDPGERTPRAHSPALPSADDEGEAVGRRRMTIANPPTSEASDYTSTVSPRPYKGFPSEEAYLSALRAWAEERSYLHAGEYTLCGFYGTKTMQEYAADRGPPLEGLGLRRKWRARRERKAGERERAKSLA